jgi:hypothetical protein
MARIGLSACECEMPRMPSVPDASTGLAEEEIADAPLGVKCHFWRIRRVSRAARFRA